MIKSAKSLLNSLFRIEWIAVNQENVSNINTTIFRLNRVGIISDNRLKNKSSEMISSIFFCYLGKSESIKACEYRIAWKFYLLIL